MGNSGTQMLVGADQSQHLLDETSDTCTHPGFSTCYSDYTTMINIIWSSAQGFSITVGYKDHGKHDWVLFKVTTICTGETWQ